MKIRDHRAITRELRVKHKAETTELRKRIATLETHNASLLDTIKAMETAHRLEVEHLQATFEEHNSERYIPPAQPSANYCPKHDEWFYDKSGCTGCIFGDDTGFDEPDDEEPMRGYADDVYCCTHDLWFNSEGTCPGCEAEEDRLDISKQADYRPGEFPTARREDEPHPRDMPFI